MEIAMPVYSQELASQTDVQVLDSLRRWEDEPAFIREDGVAKASTWYESIDSSFAFQDGRTDSHEEDMQNENVANALLNENVLPMYTLEEIEKITRDFSTPIGCGGFGMVYKGWLQDDKLIGVKKLQRNKYDADVEKQQFMNELRLLSGIRHENVVRLIGYQCQGHDEKADIFSLGCTIIENMEGQRSCSKCSETSPFTEIVHDHWRSMLLQATRRMCTKASMETLITDELTRPSLHDIHFLLDSGTGIRTAADVAKMKPLPACITAPNMDNNAPTAADSVVLVLDSGASVLALAPSMHRHLSQSNLTDERSSNKPRSNRASETNSSDDTTLAQMAQKLTSDEAENQSDPNSCVAERDTIKESKRSGEWFLATGAAHHATWDRALITNLVDVECDGLWVHAADGTPMPVLGLGSVVTDSVVLPDVHYVPGLCINLVSVGQLAGQDYCVGFGRGACVVSDAAGTEVGRAHARGDGLYEVDFLRVPLVGGMPSTTTDVLAGDR